MIVKMNSKDCDKWAPYGSYNQLLKSLASLQKFIFMLMKVFFFYLMAKIHKAVNNTWL